MEPHQGKERIQMTHQWTLSWMTAHMEPHPAREWIQMTPMDIYMSHPDHGMTAHMDPPPAREWIQMTPMDIITDDGSYGTTPSQGMDPDDTNGHRYCGIVVYCLLATVHNVSSRSRMTAHMEPHPAREWIHMTPMDIVNGEFWFYSSLLYMSHRDHG
eukprot:scaffold78889_cov44-Attheya_sp.AAC.2